MAKKWQMRKGILTAILWISNIQLCACLGQQAFVHNAVFLTRPCLTSRQSMMHLCAPDKSLLRSRHSVIQRRASKFTSLESRMSYSENFSSEFSEEVRKEIRGIISKVARS
jgi:hypothetical protein